MFLSPAIVYLLVWSIPFLLIIIVGEPIFPSLSNGTMALIFIPIIFFFIYSILLRKFYSIRRGNCLDSIFHKIDTNKLIRVTKILFIIWLIIYLINIVASGGLPIWWKYTGNDKTYVDFGVPTLWGLGNMIRAIILTNCYIIVKKTSGLVKARYYLIGGFLIFSALVLELSRGNAIFLILHPLSLYFLLYKVTITRFMKWGVIGLIFVMLFGIIQVVRYDDGYNILKSYSQSQGLSVESPVILLAVPTIFYTTKPIINVDLNVRHADLYSISPYYTTQGLIPGFIRESVFGSGDYGVLINDANNVTSYLTPIVRDFGLLGALVVVSFILLICAIIWRRAYVGEVNFILAWPPLFTSLTLSFFSLYFTSLVVVLYPLVTYFIARFVVYR